MLPNFIIVGAEKAGTTTLADTLSRHPEVFMCNPKEPRFFATYRNRDAGLHYNNWDRGLHWYESLFNGANGYKAIGEASPAYTWAPDSMGVPKRIYQCLGDIRYIYVVRNPINRIVSHYQHALFYRWIPDHTTFETSLELIPVLKNCSRYFYQIEQYLPYTRREQWHIVILEELIQAPNSIAREMFRFLEVDDISMTQLQAKNVTDEKRRPPMLIKQMSFLKPYLPYSAVQLGKRLLIRMFARKIKKPIISVDIRDALIEELKPDIQRLSEFYGKDFKTIWGIG